MTFDNEKTIGATKNAINNPNPVKEGNILDMADNSKMIVIGGNSGTRGNIGEKTLIKPQIFQKMLLRRKTIIQRREWDANYGPKKT